MVLCCSCRRLAPKDSTFCPCCGKGLAVTCCANGHVTPGTASIRFCPVCRSTQVTPPTPSLNLGCVSRLLAWVLVIVGLRFLVGHLDWVFAGIGWLFSFIFGVAFQHLFGFLMEITVLWVIVVGAINLASPDLARALNPFPKLIPWLFRIVWLCVVVFAKILLRLVEGPSATPKRETKLAVSEEEQD